MTGTPLIARLFSLSNCFVGLAKIDGMDKSILEKTSSIPAELKTEADFWCPVCVAFVSRFRPVCHAGIGIHKSGPPYEHLNSQTFHCQAQREMEWWRVLRRSLSAFHLVTGIMADQRLRRQSLNVPITLMGFSSTIFCLAQIVT
ncbi:hypothetical protein [Paraburkholderia sp.]|jgi:hypothetical protein|uniref:hypothetical protein n=1 Tax=Paraburkholderia sp. TaxID=1926495 RepID=UPI002F42AB2F